MKYKIGDYVKVLNDSMNDTSNDRYIKGVSKNDIILIESFGKVSHDRDSKVAITAKGEVVYIEDYPKAFTFAKPDEITKAGYETVYDGDLKGFPKDIVNRMLYEQVKQGNKADVTVFDNHISSSKHGNGFNWNNTEAGNDFWEKVLTNHNIELFFKQYPRGEKEELEEYLTEDYIKDIEDLINIFKI